MTTDMALQAEVERLRARVAELEAENARLNAPASPPSQQPRIEVLGVPIAWQLDQGTCTFLEAPVATMFVAPTLAGLMSGFQKMVGTERFFLAMQSEGRQHIDIDWQIICNEPDFESGFRSWARFPVLAGWGQWEIVALDREQQECHIRVYNSFEGIYQRSLGVCWGSGIAAGKCAGIFSLLFETNCWAEQESFLALGDAYDSFVVRPSDRSLEQELGALLVSDAATRADLAVAVERLHQEVVQRQQIEEELQRQAAELRRNQTLLQGLIDAYPAIIYAKDLDGRIILINRRGAQFLGVDHTSIIGKSDEDFLPPDMAEAARAQDHRVAATGQISETEETLPLSDSTLILSSVKFPLYNEQGTIYAVGGITTDITERKRTEEALRESEQWFRQLTSSLFDGVVMLEEGYIIDANEEFAQMLGYAPEELIGVYITEIFAPESRELVQYHVSIYYGQPYRASMLRKDGSTFPVEILGKKQTYRGRTVRVSTVRDMSDLQRQEEERAALQQQVIDAQSAAIRELSTPLIPLADNVVSMPLIGTIDSQRAQQVLETLLEGVATHRAEVAILDITGVSIVDTQVAQALVHAAQAVKLLGAQVVLTGIQPPIAQTLVHLGVDLSGVVTRSSLQAGIAYALGMPTINR